MGEPLNTPYDHSLKFEAIRVVLGTSDVRVRTEGIAAAKRRIRTRRVAIACGALVAGGGGALTAALLLHDVLAAFPAAVVLLLLGAGSIVSSFSSKLREEDGSARALVVFAGLLLIIAGLATAALGQDSKEKAPPPPPPRPTQPAPTWKQRDVDPSARHLLSTPQGPYWWGGRFAGPVGSDPTITAPGDIDDLALCWGSLVPTFSSGKAARYRRDGHRATEILRVSTMPARVACDNRSYSTVNEKSVFFSVPGNDVIPGSVLRTRASDLAVQAAIGINGRVGPLHFAFGKLLVGDPQNELVADVSVGVTENSVKYRMGGVPEPSEIESSNSGAVVIESHRGCIRPLALDEDRADQAGVRLRGLVGTALSDRNLLVLYDAGRRVIRLDADTLKPLGPAVALPAWFRATSIIRDQRSWQLLDPDKHVILHADDDKLRSLEMTAGGNRRDGHHKRPSALPPCM
jgi:hypothetical protein